MPPTLTALAIKYHSDKFGHHNYTPVYENYFSKWRNETIAVLELGIGGYDDPSIGGSGLQMYAEYFPNALIAGVDLYDKSTLDTNTIKTFRGSQDDKNFLMGMINDIGNPTIIIDDASHMNKFTIASFEILFPLLQPGGLYCIEDIESSWWEDKGFDGCKDYTNMEASTIVNYFRRHIDVVNKKSLPGLVVKDGLKAKAVHFYENLIIVEKP